MVELKSCPFCGGEVIQYHAQSYELQVDFGYRFFCKNNCCMQVKFYPTIEKATEDWNKRVSQESYRIPSKEEYRDMFSLPKQHAGYKKRECDNNG